MLFSIPFLTKESSNPFEPYTPVPEARFRAMKKLSDAGITTGIGIAPVLLSYNDSEIPLLLEKARKCGATKAFMSILHLDSDSIENYFRMRLEEKIPTKANKILNHIKRERDGQLQHKSYAERNTGKTSRWKIATDLFNLHFKQLGFEKSPSMKKAPRKQEPIQQRLF